MRLVLSRAMVRFSPMFSSLITASILRQYCLTAQACLLIDNYNCPSYNCDYLLQLQLRHEGGLHVKIFCPPAIYANGDVLVLSSVFELNEASNEGGAAQFVSTTSSLQQVLLGTTTRSFYLAMTLALIVMGVQWDSIRLLVSM